MRTLSYLLMGTVAVAALGWGDVNAENRGIRRFWERLMPSSETTAPGSPQYTAEVTRPNRSADGWNPVGTEEPTPTIPTPLPAAGGSLAVGNLTPTPAPANALPKPEGTTGAKSLPDPYPVEKRMFQLPFENLLSTKPLEQVREVRLYASRDQGKNWIRYQTFPRAKLNDAKEARLFNVQTAKDGEYWFVISLVDAEGAEFPRTDGGPTWRIIVNTSGKPLDTSMLANSAPKEEKKVPVWTPDPEDNTMETADSSGSSDPNSVTFSVADANAKPEPPTTLPVYKIAKPAPIDTGTGGNDGTSHQAAYPAPSLPELPTGTEETPLDTPPATLETPAETPAETSLETAPAAPADDLLLSLSAPANEESASAAVRYLNKPRLTVEYDVSTVGSSGVGKVELWGTLDGGQTWQLLGEDKDCQSPMMVDLKEDGEYGLCLVVLNGAGVGGERPVAGTLPQMQVVLDRVIPRLRLESVKLMADFGELEVRWHASDPHFGPSPILLSWSSAMEGPWRAMSGPLENSGSYSWRIPEKLPGKIFIRMDAGDLARNSSTLVTGPVLTDLVRPTGIIRDIK
ncbi:MAG: hypothetical protein Q4D98_10730 [Planctomycetia bacterium]|nr:hypothetical protein [Planctomycetia bacterium]